jgi:GntR family transcriptional repressor for pyruvate dehydrogenase complex
VTPEGSTSALASTTVHRGLRARILSGELAPGDAVPSERVLSEELGVNRHAVREALKRLQQAGLVQITQGGATRVRDWRSSAGLEVLLDLVQQGSEPTGELIRSVLEMRASVGTDAARLCAARGSKEARDDVRAAADATADAIEGGDVTALEGFVSLWERIVDGSENVAYRLGLNSLNAALAAYPELGESLAPRDGDSLRALGAAVGSGDEGGAAAAARALLEPDASLAG